MPALGSAQDLLNMELLGILSAENQISRVLPRLQKKATSESLKEMIAQRLEQGETLIRDIDEALEELEAPKARPKNVAAAGLIEDAQKHLKDVKDERLIDPLLLASMQKVEHYCIAAWGTAAAMGRMLEQETVVEAMERALDEGKQMDAEMSELAESELNPAMLEGEEEEEEMEEEEEEEGEEEEKRGRRK